MNDWLVLAVKTWTVVFILALLISMLAGTLFVKSASANPDGLLPNLAMPVEYVTILLLALTAPCGLKSTAITRFTL